MLKTTILNTLLVCYRASRTMPRSLLKRECEMQHGGKIGDGDFDTALGDLLDKQLVDFVVDGITDDRKYHLTQLGQTKA